MLYFGSFNPIHRGHIALAEYVVERDLCDELIMVVSPQNPLKSSDELAPELERFTMAELACGASAYPERIKPSLIEFMLPRPSYTINTLRHLSSEYGSQMEFSILVGGDIMEQIEQWREYREILDKYPIYLYPRGELRGGKYADRVTLLEGAPLLDVSSTEIRTALLEGRDVGEWLSGEVIKHIRDMGLWSSETARYMERGRTHYQNERWGEALNDFNRVLERVPDHSEARELADMTRRILDYRYTDIYNP